ncbi:hypothetical protein PybrP1_012370 [[Pythium] brassicae (nom. inval.)]|nr:hypothetical protein PybrP1_012370 [[Pythium] brassicae (nom. inval.)]
MGLAQSHAEFFRDANRVDGDHVEAFEYLRREERALWRETPWWELRDDGHRGVGNQRADGATGRSADGDTCYVSALMPPDPTEPLSLAQALELVPKMMHDGWIAPLVALVGSVDAVVQSVGLALLAKIVRTEPAEEIFIRVGGMDTLVELLHSELSNVQYLTLEAIFSLCARNGRIVPKFCGLGLVRHLATLTRSGAPELVLASLKILRLTLHDDAVKAELAPCAMFAVLMELIASPNEAIAKASVICIGLSLPNAANLEEIVRLGCVDAFLKLMTPGNPNAGAVAFALSLIAAEADAIFPREATVTTSVRMLETLRGAAKRSRAASAMGFLFAALVKSPLFYRALCTESNLSILSKLLVGGSADVLCASAYALGVVGLHDRDFSVTELLFRVDAPQHLLKLLSLSPPSSAKVVRLALFALACALQDGMVLSSATGAAVHPDVAFPDSLRRRMVSTCQAMLAAPGIVDQIYDCAVLQLSTGSAYAAKLLVCLSNDDAIKQRCCNASCVQHMLTYTRSASSSFLAPWLAFFVDEALCLCIEQQQRDDSSDSETAGGVLSVFVALFEHHAPDAVFGLPVLLRNFVQTSNTMKAALSIRAVVEHTLAAVTRLNHVALHDQALRFLETLTEHKNDRALRVLFESDPDRVANLLHSPVPGIQLLAATLLRRVFKRLNAANIPSLASQRHLAKLLSGIGDASAVAVAAVRVWGNLFLHDDKRVRFAAIPNAVDALLGLVNRCTAACSTSSTGGSTDDATAMDSACLKDLHVAVRSVHRSALSSEVQRAIVAAPHFLCLVDLFMHADERVVHLVIETLIEIAQAPALRKHVAVAAVLSTMSEILHDRKPGSASRSVARVDVLRLAGVLGKKEPWTQSLLLEYKIVDRTVALLHSELAVTDQRLLHQCLETLAWTASGVESPARSVVATAKMVDTALHQVEAADKRVASAALHLLQRLSLESAVKGMVGGANGPAAVMRALSKRSDLETRRRACSLIRNLALCHDANRAQFQSLGANSYLVTLVTSCALEGVTLKLCIKGLEALSAMAEGTSTVAKRSKHEVIECEDSLKLVRLVSAANDRRVCTAWCFALAMLAFGSSGNQRKLVSAGGVVALLVRFLSCAEHPPLRVHAAQLLAYLAAMPENRAVIVKQGGDALLVAMIDALQSELHELQRFTALLVANLATRSDANKVRIGASGAVSPLVDRLSSKQLNVVENVLSAVTKLGSHAGNKVKFGSKVCFEKLLALVHHDELAIRKSAVGAIAVLIEGNDGNKKFLLQCEACVVTELCALMKSTNGKVVESAMLILGELSLLPDQALEISKFVDILAVVRMVEHVNVKIKRAALTTAVNLTKESFNKLRFGVRECIAALLLCLKSDDLVVVELAVRCLANLSFTAANASQIAQANALVVLLKLTAASTTSKDYLTWKEARFLRLDKNHAVSERSPQKEASAAAASVLRRDSDDGPPNGGGDGVEGEWSDGAELSVYAIGGIEGESDEVLDFSSFPSRQTAVLEQALLVLSNCAEEFHGRGLVEAVAIKVVCQALQHPSELVKRCACFVLGVWCKQDPQNQEVATAGGVLPTLIQLLNSPNVNVVEAAMYALCKLSYFGDNHAKMLALDVLTTLVQGILRRPGNLAHHGLLDRSLRLLGTLVGFPKIRQVIKSEEIISDILTGLLQVHRDALAKNTSRLVLAMLREDSLRFFLPKKTVTLLRAIFTDASTGAKAVRNILRIFRVLALVEEHKTTIALEDSGEALGRMVQELHVVAEVEENLMRIPVSAPNADTILQLLASISSTKRVAAILFEKRLHAVLPQYLAPFESTILEGDESRERGDSFDLEPERLSADLLRHLEMNANAVVIAKYLCVSQQDKAVARLSSLEFSALLLQLLRTSLRLVPTRLTCLAFECLVLLDKLSSSSATGAYDQQVLFQEAAVDVLAFSLDLWLRVVADGGDRTTLVLDCECAAIEAVEPFQFVVPLAQIYFSLAVHQDNRTALVYQGCTTLLLQAMAVSALSSDLRLSFVRTFAALSELPAAKEFFDRDDHVAPLFKFMFAHQSGAELLLFSLRSFASIVERSPASRRHVLDHAPALSFLLECLADAESDRDGSKVHFAIHALECLSTEQEIALRLAPLATLPLVPRLLLLPLEAVSRQTQYFATEMVGHMAFFGHADRLKLEERMVARILSFAALEDDALATPASARLALWSLAQLAKSSISTTVCTWIVDDASRLNVLVKCGLLPPADLVIPSAVVGYVLSILIRIVDVEAVVSVLVNRRICTPLSALLEAVEQDIRLTALRILSLLLPRYKSVAVTDVLSARVSGDGIRSEHWATILRHLVEWMEVYARDLASCSSESLLDAYTSLSFIMSLSDIVPSDFQSWMLRTGIAEIVATTLFHFEAKRQRSAAGEAEASYERILLRALEVSFSLLRFASAYSDRFLALGVQSVLENVLHLESAELQVETLQCMNHLATLGSERSLLFSSHRCVVRLRQLANEARLDIAANVTPLLALMATHAPSLPGLCCLDGVNVVSSLVLTHWTPQRSDMQARVTEDGCTVLLSMFAPEANVFALYDQASVLAKMFEIVVERGMPELPLQVLLKISDYAPSHARFMSVLPALCRLLDGPFEQLGSASHHLVLSILRNLFCPDIPTDDKQHAQRLAAGEGALLPQLLPLSRWVRVSDSRSVEIVLKLLRVFLRSPRYATLLNDGANTPPLLELVAATSTGVAIAAATLLLIASNEREMQISITVEDGVGSLVRTLRRSDDLLLQCLILTILRDMSPDSEVQVLVLNENGVARLVEFVSKRTSALFASDERLRLACEILRQLSRTPSAVAQIVASHGHARVIELSGQQLASRESDEQERTTTLEVLSNLAKSSAVAQHLIDTKLHELFLLCVLSSESAASSGVDESASKNAHSTERPRCEWLALAGLRSLCQWNKPIRRTLGSKSELVSMLEAIVALAADAPTPAIESEQMETSLALLQYLSKVEEGRASIFAKSSSQFLGRLCKLISASTTLTSAKTLLSSSAGGGKTAQETTPSPLAITGVKTVANLLADSSHARLQVDWQFADLLSLSPLLELLLANHQQPKLQLTALQVLRGAFLSPSFYFQLSPQMLGDLLNVLLISASRRHCALAEDVVVHAFRDAQRVRASIGGNQILERLLIVVTQKTDSEQRRALGAALTEALYVSIARAFVVNQRFLSKLLSLLASMSEVAKGGGERSHEYVDNEDAPLVRALCVYLGFVFARSSSEHALQHSIRAVLRSEVNATALEAIAGQVVATHSRICRLAAVAGGSQFSDTSCRQENLELWTLFAECLDPSATHIQRVVHRVPLVEWLCLVDDFFALDERHAVVQAALTALLDIRDGWGESCLLVACNAYSHTGALLVQLLPVFHSPSHALDRSRHLLLQLLVALVSTGSFVEELKASALQRAIENNELISAADKALPITILSLLGYNADLNSEFAAVLERCASATSAVARKDGLAFLVDFLQLYALTDETLQQKAVDVFMSELVAYAAVYDDNVGSTEEEAIASRAVAQSAVAGLVKLSAARKFVEFFLHEWTLNALLGVAFARKRGDQANGFQERAGWAPHEVNQLLEIASRVCGWLGSPSTSARASVEAKNLANSLTLAAALSRDELPLVEQILEVLNWLVSDPECFEAVCMHASMLGAFLPFLFEYTDSAAALLTLLETCVRGAGRIGDMSGLLAAMLDFVYTNAEALGKAGLARDKLLLYILLALKRLGDEGLSGCEAYEHAIQLILANVRAPIASEARISWSLLGMLTEFDPAIVLIFNVDGAHLLLRELCAEPPASSSRAGSGRAWSRSSVSASDVSAPFRMEALKCLSKAARTHDEVLFKIGEASGVAPILFAVLASGPEELTPLGGATMSAGECQEHAAHLIARLSSQEDLRASLLSPDHVSVLIESMESVHLAVVLSALEALYHLCEFALCLDALVRHATVPVLGQILFSPLAEGETQEKTEEFVLGILASMCAKSALICRRVVSSNMVHKLDGYLGAARSSVQHSAAWVLHSLSKDAELVPKLRDAGVLETLCDRLLDYDPRTTQRKALGALANLVAARGRESLVSTDAALVRAVIRETVEAMNRNLPHPHAQQAIAKGLDVFEAIAAQGDDAKRMLVEASALPMTLALLGAPDASVRLKALQVAATWVAENADAAQVRELFSDAALLHLVRAISEELSDALLVALALLHTLAGDELLKEKLASMAYEVLLRLVVTHASPSPTVAQSRALAEALKCLVAMTRSGRVAVATASEIVNSVEPLVVLLRTSSSDAIRICALHLLVNFASSAELRGAMLRCGMVQALVAMLATAVKLGDDKVAQLCLLGMALLTAVDFREAVADLAGANVATLVGLLGSRNRSLQANAVWVLSNISSEESLKSEIVARGGATTLQAVLNEAISSSSGSDGAPHASGGGSARPTSSSMRIREYAPKAIRSLGFAPLTHEGSTATPRASPYKA